MRSQTSSKTTLDSVWQHLLVAPVVWGIYFLVGYGLVEVVCVSPWLNAQWNGFSVLSLLILALTVVAFLITFYAAWVAYRSWRRVRRRSHSTDLEAGASPPVRTNATESPRQAEEDSDHFLALSGALLGGLFALTILITGVPALVLNPCG